MSKIWKELTFASVVITLAFKAFIKYIRWYEEHYGFKQEEAKQ